MKLILLCDHNWLHSPSPIKKRAKNGAFFIGYCAALGLAKAV
ncbi:hypothetical protein O59_003538 [Cellvibrio sp. BR]|nr:hypothetical protein O59_003538 [Cellvibrio sp. BR]